MNAFNILTVAVLVLAVDGWLLAIALAKFVLILAAGAPVRSRARW